MKTDKGVTFERLIHLSKKKGLQVKFASLQYNYGRLRGDRVAIANDIDIDKINYTLAHEIAHAYLHYDKGDILGQETYEQQADRAAAMLLDLCEVGI